ncbi:fimbrial protein [Dyella flagellata]|nr:fimbrial protein [Dyella flagellata]
MALALLSSARKVWAEDCSSSPEMMIPGGPMSYTRGIHGIEPGASLNPVWTRTHEVRQYKVFSCEGRGDLFRETVTIAGRPISGLDYQYEGLTYPVFATGVEGIGYVIRMGGFARSASGSFTDYGPWQALGVDTLTIFPWPGGGSWGAFFVGFAAGIQFIFTNHQLRPGTYMIPPLHIGTASAYGGSGQLKGTSSLDFAGATITFTASTCQVPQSSQAVRLNTVRTSDFSAVGTEAAGAPFHVQVNCEYGVALYATMSDVTDRSNRSDTLNLTGNSTATGVKLRIYREGERPVSYGPDSTAPGNSNQWKVGGSSTTQATNYSLPFEARYVKTEGNITPGKVQAQASITFSYQ